MKLPDDLFDRVEQLTGSRPVDARTRDGGYSIAGHWTLELADGRKVFAKLATTDDIARRLRDEHRNLAAIQAEYLCRIVAWQDSDRPLLLLEDLSHGYWPPPWRVGDVERVLEALERVWSTPAPTNAPTGEIYWARGRWWPDIANDPTRFLGLGMCSREWLDACLPTLLEAERGVILDGHDLVHGDIWSSNICLLEDRVVFVDWNFASRGDRRCDVALWLPSLRLEGGPLPEEVRTGLAPHAAMLAGFFAESGVLPPPEGAPRVREFQLRQLRIALPWACRELGLPEPDLPWAMAEIDRADADLAAKAIDDNEWYARVEQPLTDAYLSYAEPWRQSGKGGDETDWRWGRELALDIVADGDAVLDVGCANGYLMESFHRWGAERGMHIEPYGVDISWRLVSLARRRLPQWADRIFEANVMHWTPPRRFDIVHTALDYMPRSRRREHVDRVLSDFLAPGGRLVLRAARIPKGPDPAEELEAIGCRPDGIIESTHPHTGEIRRTAYVRAPG